MSARKPLIAGNWKMNGLRDSIEQINQMSEITETSSYNGAVDLMICPPVTLVVSCVQATQGSSISIGAQDCHTSVSGAHTGDVSPEMLADAGATAVILGHSERRADHGERDQDTNAKALAAYRGCLKAIICVGETEGQRAAGLTLDVIKRQIKGSVPEMANSENTVIAYEPVWAIGTGLTPTVNDVADIHLFIREQIKERLGDDISDKMRILYGGSVKPSNAAELMAADNVDGALVGGASLKAIDFCGIASVYSA